MRGLPIDPGCVLPGANNWDPTCASSNFDPAPIVPAPNIEPGQGLGPDLSPIPQLTDDLGNPLNVSVPAPQFGEPGDIFIGFQAPPVMPSTRPSAPSFSPTGPNYGPAAPNFEPILQPGAGSGPARPPDFYTPENPPPNLPPPELPAFAALPADFALGAGLLGVGLAGIGLSLRVGAPAPDEYPGEDIQGLIDSGFYGNLIPRYQPPDNPSQTELAPAVAPTLEPEPFKPLAPEETIPGITVTGAPLEQPVISPYVVAPAVPIEAPYAPIARPDPVGLPGPHRVSDPGARPGTRPSVAPGGAPAPLPAAQPGTEPVPLPSPSPTGSPVTAPGSPSQTGPQLRTGPAPTQAKDPNAEPQPFTLPQLQPSPPKPALAQIVQGEPLGSVPRFGNPPSSKGCEAGPQKQQQKKKSKPRQVCHVGTYRELKKGLIKHAQRTVPCQ